ncbi:MAG: DUF1572 domain-containing protein [Ignavibacteriales bacterium]|nr:MAG: DUF1572 domain-containing protein [Ignavibacteriales bacterium]
MENISLGKLYLKELKAEVPASRKCLERITPELFGWKPHEKSMNMGYLAILVADMPRWITTMIEKTEIDFATYEQLQAKSSTELVEHFDENIKNAKNALQSVSEDVLSKTFYLKNQGQVLFNQRIDEAISSTLNHWVHHRGQLTVYMRLNDIPVPSIYGPSADEKTF